MKKAICLSLVLLPLASSFVFGDLIEGIKYSIGIGGFIDMQVSPGQDEAYTDSVPDSTTVKATLTNNPEKLRWELKFQGAISNDPSLSDGYDIGPDTKLAIAMLIYPRGHPETINSVKVMGKLDGVQYDTNTNMLHMQGGLTDLEPSETYPEGMKNVFMAYFSYAGNSESDPGGKMDLGNTVLESNVWIDDVGYGMHPSSMYLWGQGFSVSGKSDTDAMFNLFTTRQFAESSLGNMPAENAGGFVDGFIPGVGFSYSNSLTVKVDYSLTSEAEEEPGDNEVIKYSINYSHGFSTRDMQIGFYSTFPYGAINTGPDWYYFDWLGFFYYVPVNAGWVYHEGLSWMYVPVDADYVSGFPAYYPPLGWIYTSASLFPDVYVFDYEGQGFWASYLPEIYDPTYFYRYDNGEYIVAP